MTAKPMVKSFGSITGSKPYLSPLRNRNSSKPSFSSYHCSPLITVVSRPMHTCILINAQSQQNSGQSCIPSIFLLFVYISGDGMFSTRYNKYSLHNIWLFSFYLAYKLHPTSLRKLGQHIRHLLRLQLPLGICAFLPS